MKLLTRSRPKASLTKMVIIRADGTIERILFTIKIPFLKNIYFRGTWIKFKDN